METCSRLRHFSPYLALFFVFALGISHLDAQSIFKDRRDRDAIIPSIVPPEGPPLLDGTVTGEPEMIEPTEGEPGENTEVVEGEAEEGKQEEPSEPALSDEEKTEIALNRERDESANVSSPGIVALFKQAGRLTDMVGKVDRIQRDPTIQYAIGEAAPAKVNEQLDQKLASTFETQPDARTFTFSVPAPRGQILDRKGKPLAQNKVVNYAAIMFPHWGEEPEEMKIYKFAADRINYVNTLLGTNWDLKPKIVKEHYANRRWMPLLFSGALTKNESEKIGKAKPPGLSLVPVYLRHYPNEEMLSHVVGYVGKRPPRSTRPIASDEPIWGEAIGAYGLELAFDEQLTGTPGRYSLLYDGNGNKIREDRLEPPRPGSNVVTSIDIEMQRLVERLLREKTHRGAMVVMDCNNGDVLAMGSHPQFNPNDFIPAISTEKYKELLEDPEKPMFPRAFQASYPPASTYKVVSAISFLESGYIDQYTTYPCPSSWTIGNLTMKNWNSSTEGYMNVVGALARSCNTWFYEIAINVGADAMSSVSNRLGLGEKTGLPLPEDPGFIPNNRYWVDKYGYNLSDGDEANMSIGQGRVKATPLQVARMMAAIGNQERVLKPRLVKQIQDVNHNVLEVYPTQVRNSLNFSTRSLAAVRKGMWDVVNAGHGTGKAGQHKITVSAKTGTGQWKPNDHQNIAWFAGYFPAKNPVYSFAIVYEGNPYETVSGGRSAAPIVSEFMNEYLNTTNYNEIVRRSRELRGDYTPMDYTDIPIERTVSPSIVEEPQSIFRGPNGETSHSPLEATPAEPVEEQPEQRAQEPRRTSIFNRIFGGRRRR